MRVRVLLTPGRSVYLAVMLDKMGAMMILPLLPYIATQTLVGSMRLALHADPMCRSQTVPKDERFSLCGWLDAVVVQLNAGLGMLPFEPSSIFAVGRSASFSQGLRDNGVGRAV